MDWIDLAVRLRTVHFLRMRNVLAAVAMRHLTTPKRASVLVFRRVIDTAQITIIIAFAKRYFRAKRLQIESLYTGGRLRSSVPLHQSVRRWLIAISDLATTSTLYIYTFAPCEEAGLWDTTAISDIGEMVTVNVFWKKIVGRLNSTYSKIMQRNYVH